MDDESGPIIVVAGGTGNIGSHIVRALLERGATVVVPSRSEEKLRDLRDYLRRWIGEPPLERLRPLLGDVGSQAGAEDLARRAVDEIGEPAGVLASLGTFVPAHSLVAAETEALRQVLDGYTVAHFNAARAFVPRIRSTGGRYVFVNGPLAFAPWPNSGAGLVSIATAAQHMLFRALAQELDDAPVEVTELVVYAFVRGRETQPGSAVTAEETARHAAALLLATEPGRHGESIHLRSSDGR